MSQAPQSFKTGGSGLLTAGTTNALPKYTGGSTLGNSKLADTGTQLQYNSLNEPTIVSAPATATGLVAANTNFINFTPPAAAGVYEIKWAVDTTTATTDTFTVVVTYKNATGTARTQNSGGFDKAGTSLVAGAITSTIGAGNYYGSMMFSIDNSATPITLSTAGTFTTVTYNLDARLYVV
jgi:hypothetical protein